MASIASGRPLQEAHEALMLNIARFGDIQAAMRQTCTDLLPAPKTLAAPIRIEGDFEFDEMDLQRRTVTRPTITELARGSAAPSLPAATRIAREESPAQPTRLFQQRFNTEMRNAGGNLTASQRLSTAMNRAESGLLRDAWNARLATRQLEEDPEMCVNDGSTPASAAAVNSTQTWGSRQPSAPPSRTPLALQHASPAVRVA
jgi:hypothetical protein